MNWYAYLCQLISGLLLTNAVPHLVHGLSGAPFQSPFASPPGVGESSPLVNFYWGFANLAGGAALLVRFAPTNYAGWGMVAAGVLLLGTFCARHFGRVRAAA
jgi:hypothetical protein